MSDAPTALPVIAHAIPDELKERRQFVAWKYVSRGGKWTKVPINPDMGSHAQTDAPSTWGTFAQARDRQCTDRLPGVGYVFSPADPYCGIDFDKCRDPETGALDPEVRAMIGLLDSYSEISPSGTGVKVVIRAAITGDRNRKTTIEMYDALRFFTLTGHRLPDAPEAINERQPQLDQLYRRVFGDLAAGGERVHLPEIESDDSAGGALWRWAYPRLSVRMMRVANLDDTDYEGDASRGDAALVLALRRMGMTDQEVASAFAASPRGPALEARKPGRSAELIRRALESSRAKLAEVVRA
jgi:primase-polymerase (primpol)-like protein